MEKELANTLFEQMDLYHDELANLRNITYDICKETGTDDNLTDYSEFQHLSAECVGLASMIVDAHNEMFSEQIRNNKIKKDAWLLDDFIKEIDETIESGISWAKRELKGEIL